MVDLTIIILDYNRKITQLLNSIPIMNNVQVLVIDDGSTEDILGEGITRPFIYQRLPNNEGAGHARKVAVELIKKQFPSKYFMFIDSDQLPCDLNKILHEYLNKDFEVLSTATKLIVNGISRIYESSSDFLNSFSLCGYIINSKLLEGLDIEVNPYFGDEIPLKLGLYMKLTEPIITTDYISVSEVVSKNGLTNESYHNWDLTNNTVKYISNKIIELLNNKSIPIDKLIGMVSALVNSNKYCMDAYMRYNGYLIHTCNYVEDK